MKATFALLLDHNVHNMVRKLAVEVHQAYQIGLVGSQLPPHVSLKQPFLISDLSTLEAYFDQLAKSIDPLILSFPRIAGPGNAPILWLEVEETETLRQLHTRINQELAERFSETQAPFDGSAYHFHLTIALGGASSSVYQSMVAELESRNVAFQAIARHLVLFYYDDDQYSPGSFLTYKILPLGKTPVGLDDTRNG
ncbi:MAG TPA: 2'-5' RNA ligase family protein [Ktedonosporobacter sp.]|nr:2'-5' RNA ligase family protein [Ktedonosporobacter sp.]